MSDHVDLTDDEIACLKLRGQGLNNKQIAQRLSYSLATVARRLQSASHKLGTGSDTIGAYLVAVRDGLIEE